MLTPVGMATWDQGAAIAEVRAVRNRCVLGVGVAPDDEREGIQAAVAHLGTALDALSGGAR